MHTDCTEDRQEDFARMKMGVITAIGTIAVWSAIAWAVFL